MNNTDKKRSHENSPHLTRESSSPEPSEKPIKRSEQCNFTHFTDQKNATNKRRGAVPDIRQPEDPKKTNPGGRTT